MERIQVTGGRLLCGTVRPPAAKNSVLPLLAATLLCDGPCTLKGVPRLADVRTSLELLAAIGAFACRNGSDITTRPAAALDGRIPPKQAGAMRSSVFYLAPLLCRTGMVELPLPGGCRLGPRPVDIHLDGLAAMGAAAELRGDTVVLRSPGRLHGADFTLKLPSVGATETLLMAASVAQGVTVLRGAACEPEVQDLAAFLNACGAGITGAGTPIVVVYGRPSLQGTSFAPMPDRIAACTYAAAAAAAGGGVRVEGCRPEHLQTFLSLLRAMGCAVREERRAFTVVRDPGRPLLGGQQVYASAYPGFATDAAPLAAALLLGAQGASAVYDGLFDNRFACAEGFAAMGAAVRTEGRALFLKGGAALGPAQVQAPDLRGGAALVVAALAAAGTVTVEDPGHIRRGYEDLPRELRALGACCHVEQEPSKRLQGGASAR